MRDRLSVKPGLGTLWPAVLVLLGGCAMPGSSRVASEKNEKSSANLPTSLPEPQPTASESPGDPKALAAVMDFLDRTTEYRQSPGDESTPGPASRRSDQSVVHHKPDIETVVIPDGAAAGSTATTGSKPLRGAVGPVSPTASPQALANTQLSLGESGARASVAPPTVKSLRIRTVDAASPAPAANHVLNTTNQGMEVQNTDPSDGGPMLLAELAKKATDHPVFEHEWSLRLAQAALNEPIEADAVGKALPDEQRRVISGVASLLSAIRHEAVNPQLPGEEALTRAAELTAILAERADPVVPTVALCRRVVTFGVYEEMPAAEFAAGRATPTIIYCEITNLRSEKSPDGLFRSALATRVELLTADGQSVWQHEEPEISDLCRNHRGDFFIAQRVTLPATLKEGPHVLKVLVEDKLSGRAAEQTLRFTVHGGSALAKGNGK